MKNLLIYQTSEYDCGTTCLLNAIRYLFEREELCPCLIKALMTYSLDNCDEHGHMGKHGTSAFAMEFISKWVNRYSETRQVPLHCSFLSGESITFTKGSSIYEYLQSGSVAVLHLYLDCPHYVLATGVTEDNVLIFDPYYEELDDPTLEDDYFEEGISFCLDQPKKYNRVISMERLNHFTHKFYEMGEYDVRHALIFTRV